MTTSANVAKIFQGPAGWALAIGVGGLVLYFLYGKAKKDLGQAANTAGSLLSGTNNTLLKSKLAFGDNSLYAGAGIPGTLGAATNTATGGVLSSLGSWFGGALYSAVNGDYDPNANAPDRSTPVQSPGVVSNPVSDTPKVLQYNYKQATIDNPNSLLTDGLFTPSYGSSGGYADSTQSGTAAGPTTDYYDFGVTDPSSWN